MIKSVFKKFDKPLFLMFGTALGAHRDGKFLPNDGDVDFGTFGLDNRMEIYDELEKLGFVGRTRLPRMRKNLNPYKYLPVNRITSFDIYFFVDTKNENYLYCHANETTLCAIMPKRFTKLKTIKFYDKEFLIPEKTEEMLEHYYGDWENKSNTKHASVRKGL